MTKHLEVIQIYNNVRYTHSKLHLAFLLIIILVLGTSTILTED